MADTIPSADALAVPPSPSLGVARHGCRLVAAWLAGRTARTLRAYSADMEDFRAFLGASDASAAADRLLAAGHGSANELALSYRANLLARGLAPATVNRRLATLRSLVALARTLGTVPWELAVPSVKAEALRDTRGPGRNAVGSILAALAERRDPKAARDTALVRCLYDLGLRRAEVVSLDLAHLDLAGGRVSVLRKGKRDRVWLDLPTRTIEAVKAWIAVRGEAAGPLFTGFRGGKGKRLDATGVYRTVRATGRAVGVKVRPHGLRHTAITEAVKAAQAAGISLEEVRDFSGHADVRTLMIYRDRERNVQGRLAALVAESA